MVFGVIIEREIGRYRKSGTFTIVANIFTRGDIKPAEIQVVGNMSQETYLDHLIDNNGSIRFSPMNELGIGGTAPYQYGTVLRMDEQPNTVENPVIFQSRRELVSDTGELIWNQLPQDEAHILIRSSKTKGFIGFIDEEHYDLGHGVSLEVGETIQGWANILFSYMGSDEEGHHWLLTASGYHENQGMVWKSEAKESVGTDWGSGPPLVETIPLRLTFSSESDQDFSEQINTKHASVFPLDERAVSQEKMLNAIQTNSESITIDLMNESPAVWYEIRFSRNQSINDSMEYEKK